MNMAEFAKIGAAMAVSGLCCFAVMAVPWSESNLLRFFSASLAALLVYLLFVFLLRLVDLDDMQRLQRWSRKIWRRT